MKPPASWNIYPRSAAEERVCTYTRFDCRSACRYTYGFEKYSTISFYLKVQGKNKSEIPLPRYVNRNVSERQLPGLQYRYDNPVLFPSLFGSHSTTCREKMHTYSTANPTRSGRVIFHCPNSVLKQILFALFSGSPQRATHSGAGSSMFQLLSVKRHFRGYRRSTHYSSRTYVSRLMYTCIFIYARERTVRLYRTTGALTRRRSPIHINMYRIVPWRLSHTLLYRVLRSAVKWESITLDVNKMYCHERHTRARDERGVD